MESIEYTATLVTWCVRIYYNDKGFVRSDEVLFYGDEVEGGDECDSKLMGSLDVWFRLV